MNNFKCCSSCGYRNDFQSSRDETYCEKFHMKFYSYWRCSAWTESAGDTKPELSFTRSELEGWLYEIYNNNIDGSLIDRDFAEDVEEIINRLDGFEKYVEDKRREASE